MSQGVVNIIQREDSVIRRMDYLYIYIYGGSWGSDRSEAAAIWIVQRIWAHSLIFSLLALAWALKFHSSLSRELESEIRDGLHRIAHFLERRRSHTSVKPYMSSLVPSNLLEFPEQKPRILVQPEGMLVALKPPGWEVDTAIAESEALSLSAFLQSHLHAEDGPQQYVAFLYLSLCFLAVIEK